MDIQALHDSYININPKANRLRDALVSELGHLLIQSGITLGVPIEARVKEWPSISEKITRKSLSLKNIIELDDLVGIRLILLFRQDLEKIDALLKESLSIQSAEDTSHRLAEAQFGYQSRHYIVQIPDTWKKIPSFMDLGEIRVELQVRTLAQHIWAAVSHKLQYKHEASVPLPLRRSIYRASALLETVDLEFDRLLQDRTTYVKEQLKNESPDTLLNVEIIGAALSEFLPNQYRHAEEYYDELLEDLNNFGISTKGKLKDLLTSHWSEIFKSDAEQCEKHQTQQYFSDVGLVREGLRAAFGNEAVDSFLIDRATRKSN
ncbi:GTP pyrophosphokinase [Aeromonas sp. 102P]|uniref:GTP pyrophosphokinase n=1 Tax=Aeromonas sp. 102P TaxID=3452711 RepID=UPI0038F27D9F